MRKIIVLIFILGFSSVFADDYMSKLKQACNQGQGDSCTKLRAMYYNGKGVRQSKQKALKYLGKASNLKVQLGCKNYAKLNRQ